MSEQDPNPPVTQTDTTGATGQAGEAPEGTASTVTPQDTTVTGGGGVDDPADDPATQPDTSGAQGGTAAETHDPYVTVTLDTQQAGTPGGTPGVNPPYRAPSEPPAGSVRDTTLTDVQPGGGDWEPSPDSLMTGTTETPNIGAQPGHTSGNVPAAPTGVTVAAGPRYTQVSWTAPADPAGDPVLGYMIRTNKGGTAFVGKDVTTARVEGVETGVDYTFQVAARNMAGWGPFSTASAAVDSYNPDQADAEKPSGIAAANRVNPIYLPDGSVKPGTGGTNSAPAITSVTPGAAASKQVTVNWSAPTIGAAPTGYTVRSSDGEVVTVGAVLTATVTHDAAGGSVTYTVTPTNAKGTGETSAPSNAVTVP